MTAAKLAERAGVSESVVVRFASRIGYSGYPEMQQVVQDIVRAELSPAERLGRKLHGGVDGDTPMQVVFRRDRENLLATERNLSPEAVRQAAREIVTARNVWILGLIESGALARLLGLFLNFIIPQVTVVDRAGAEMAVPLKNVTSEDVVIGVSFARYAKQTVQALDYCKRKGARIIAITDSPVAPAAEVASIPLVASVEMVSFFNSYTAVISLINALVAETVAASPDRAKTELVAVDNAIESFDPLFLEEGERFKGFLGEGKKQSIKTKGRARSSV